MISAKTELNDLIWERKLKHQNTQVPNRIREAYKEIDSGRVCLDIGCGDNSFGLMACNNYKHIVGLDCSISAIKNANNEKFFNILTDFDKGNLPVRDNSIDLVTCLDVIEHVYNPEKLVQEANRVLVKNGILIITTPNIRFIDFIRSLIFEGKFPKTSQDEVGYDGGHIHYFTFADIRSLLKNKGFKIIKHRGYDRKNYLSIKVLFFKFLMKCWEKNLNREFFCPGILFKAKKI